ncbi:carbonic anhydrase 4 [Centroberyx gerrardi]
MNWLLAAFVACALTASVHCATGTVEWCYHLPSCNETQWATIAPKFCNGSRQSPINIVSASATGDSSLTAFSFTNYNSNSTLKKISNTGETVKVTLASGVQVSGGGLSEAYDSIQFHLHWGNGSSVPGSEHTVDGKQYPMELHIVNFKSSVNGNTTLALADSTGLAALGFLIEETSSNTTSSFAAWHKLTSYLANITEEGQQLNLDPGISLDDLLVGVDRTQYYRYLGSLTTPTCNEVVVWTVFKQSIKVNRELIDLFSKTVRVGNSTSPLMVNVFRSTQPALPVTTQTSGSSKGCYSLGLMALSLILGKH